MIAVAAKKQHAGPQAAEAPDAQPAADPSRDEMSRVRAPPDDELLELPLQNGDLGVLLDFGPTQPEMKHASDPAGGRHVPAVAGDPGEELFPGEQRLKSL